MTNKQFISSLRKNYNLGLGLMKRKNKDYANDLNPFKNFETSTLVGVSVEKAIMVRMLDKFTRAANLLGKDADVNDEKLEDTLLDLMNYTNILLVWLNSKNYEKEN